MIISSNLTNEDLLKSIYKSALEYSNLIGKSYLIIGKNPNTTYFWFQCHFEKKHFMHLLGIRSNTLSANEFSSQKYKILFIFEKEIKDIKYKELLMEIKKDILYEHYMHFPKDLKEKIISI